MNKGFLFTPKELDNIVLCLKEKIEELRICIDYSEIQELKIRLSELQAILARFEAEKDLGTPPGGTYINGIRV